MQADFREESGRIQIVFVDYSVRVQRKCWLYLGGVDAIFKQYSESIQAVNRLSFRRYLGSSTQKVFSQ